MRRTDIDIHDLGPGLIKEAGIQVPDAVRSSHFPSGDELDNYPDEDFALIMVDGGEVLRKYACMSPGTAWLNSMCLLGAWDRLPKTAAILAGTNLMTVLEGTATPAPLELVEKVASAVNSDLRGEGELADFGGVTVVDITDLSAEKKANFFRAAGEGFKMLGRAAKGSYQAGRGAATAAGQGGAGWGGQMAAGAKAMGGAAGQFARASGASLQQAGAGVARSANALAKRDVTRSAPQNWTKAVGNVRKNVKYAPGTNLASAGVAAAGAGATGAGIYGAGKAVGRRKQAGAKALVAAGAGGLVGGAVLGHKKGKKKGRREGFSAGYGSGSQRGYWKGRVHGQVLSQRADMARKLKELEGQKKEAAGFSLMGRKEGDPQGRSRGMLTYKGWTPGEATAAGAGTGAIVGGQLGRMGGLKGGRLGAAVGAGALAVGGAHRLHQKFWNRPSKTAEVSVIPTTLLRGDYPVENPEQIKQAEAFFNEHWRRLHPSDRRTYSTNLVKAAEAMGAPLTSERLEKYAGDAISTEAVLHLNSRSRFVDDNGREILVKLAESIPVADPDEFADALTQLDEHYGISQRWDTQIVDPYAATLAKEASSDFRWSEGPDTVTGDQLIAASHEKRVPLTSALGEDGFREFTRAPVTIFKSLPADVKHVISRIAA